MDENEIFIVDESATGINVPKFLFDLQQPTKKLRNPDYFRIFVVLIIKEVLVINIKNKIAILKELKELPNKKQKKTIPPKK